MPFSLFLFLSELNTFISHAASTPREFLITDIFNLHLDHPNDSKVKQFLTATNVPFLLIVIIISLFLLSLSLPLLLTLLLLTCFSF